MELHWEQRRASENGEGLHCPPPRGHPDGAARPHFHAPGCRRAGMAACCPLFPQWPQLGPSPTSVTAYSGPRKRPPIHPLSSNLTWLNLSTKNLSGTPYWRAKLMAVAKPSVEPGRQPAIALSPRVRGACKSGPGLPYRMASVATQKPEGSPVSSQTGNCGHANACWGKRTLI